MPDLAKQLDELAQKALQSLGSNSIKQRKTYKALENVCRTMSNRAGVRLILSCALAKLDNPAVDPREPYTEIGSETCFSGRTGYDEAYLPALINKYKLPCNPTTAYLTPALRNHEAPLLLGTTLVGRPAAMYSNSLIVLDELAKGTCTAEDVLLDTLRLLFQVRDEQESRIRSLMDSIDRSKDALPPSSEQITTLLQQHLACKYSSRLPVLGIAAAYQSVVGFLPEKALPLKGHNAADEQTGACGDVEICLVSDESLVTVYEMKKKAVTINDIDHAMHKIAGAECRLDNYIFITTDPIDPDVFSYANLKYEETYGIEFSILDYLGFLRHFLHFFHRYREAFLDAYQNLVMSEPVSAVPQTLKEAFLSLRNQMLSDEGPVEE
jgi:hypothetical protein